ncbi:MAG TPA: type 1 glutamine amidotransferase domain-containing protein [Rhodanobacteraceae bacterium]|nr:type 1 glutamine amidotransferase domain-containing protein [Rhodanobacteraceae bacterium]
MRILMVLTSHGQLGDTGKPTGLWLEELAAPYYVFKDAGAEVTLASPAGGQPPVDPASEQADSQTEATRRFHADPEATQALASTRKLAEVEAENFDAVFYPGGHGPLWDLADNEDSRLIIDRIYAAGKPVAAVCHGVAALRNALGPFGLPLIRGKAVTGFSDAEERAAGLSDSVPFLVEEMLKEAGGQYSKAADWQAHVVASGNLITGQNPASSAAAAKAVLQQLTRPAQAAA